MIHLLCATIVTFSNYRNILLLKSQRRGDVQGYRTLSDLLVNDDYFNNLSYPIQGYDEIYKQYCKWNSVYIPTNEEHYTIYRLCSSWFVVKPIPHILTNYQNVLDNVISVDYSHYVKACVAACGCCRLLCHKTSPEIGQLCSDILLYIRDLLITSVKDLYCSDKQAWSLTKLPIFQKHTHQ